MELITKQELKDAHLITLNDDNCNEVFEQLPIEAKRAVIKMLLECNRAIIKHPHWPSDIIHQAAIVSEENGELIRAALQLNFEGGHLSEVRKECVQTGAMAIRMFINL